MGLTLISGGGTYNGLGWQLKWRAQGCYRNNRRPVWILSTASEIPIRKALIFTAVLDLSFHRKSRKVIPHFGDTLFCVKSSAVTSGHGGVAGCKLFSSLGCCGMEFGRGQRCPASIATPLKMRLTVLAKFLLKSNSYSNISHAKMPCYIYSYLRKELFTVTFTSS